jgi:hypothetical protein
MSLRLCRTTWAANISAAYKPNIVKDGMNSLRLLLIIIDSEVLAAVTVGCLARVALLVMQYPRCRTSSCIPYIRKEASGVHAE